ncbi:MAG: hypothetical protein AB1782_20835 [Cyanobacteriota bacterium]
MNINQFQPLSFTSKIKFVSDDEFRARTASEPRDWSNKLFIGAPWDDAIAGPRALTEDIYGCNAGGLTNTASKDLVLFHFKPAAADYPENRFQDKIFNALGQLGQYTERLGGLIIGGKTAGSGDLNYSASLKLSQKLESLFDHLKASVTKFWGQTTSGGNTNVFYSGQEDTWYVNYKDKNKSYDSNQIRTPEDIKKAYFDIAVSDNDQVFIGEQQVHKFDLKPEFKKIEGGYELDLAPRNPFYQPQYDYSDSSWKDKNKVKLFTANFGQDPSTLWVETQNISLIEKVVEKIDEIKQAPQFNSIQKIQYAGDKPIFGFTPLGDPSNTIQIFEMNL